MPSQQVAGPEVARAHDVKKWDVLRASRVALGAAGPWRCGHHGDYGAFTTRPFRITNRTSSITRMFSSGSPSTAITSAA